MSTFNKIYKKTSNSYDLIATAGTDNIPLKVFQPSANGGTSGLLPSPKKGEQNHVFSSKDGWKDFYLTGFTREQDNDCTYKVSTSFGRIIPINLTNMITKQDYVKITNLAGGFKLPSAANNEYTSDDSIIGPVGQFYSSNTVTSNSNYQDLLCAKAVGTNITYHNMKDVSSNTSDVTGLIVNDYSLCKDMFILNNAKNNNDGVIIAPLNNPRIVSITCRFVVNSGTIGNSVEIVPFVNGTRSAAQSFTFLSGGNWGDTIIKTFIFYVPVCTNYGTLEGATNIIFKTKAFKGNPKVDLIDMIVSFLNKPGMYWLTNKETPSINRYV